MKQFQTIVLDGIINTPTFITALSSEAMKNGWVNRLDLSTTAKMSMPEYKGEYICIESPVIIYDNHSIAGIVWMRAEDAHIETFNIIPTIGSAFSVEEYNYVLQRFRVELLDPIVKSLALSILVTKEEIDIQDYIHEDGLMALEEFSRCANKTTGASHPSDFKLWCNFLFIVHRQKYYVDSDKLAGWLTENGWYDRKVVDDLVNQFELSKDFLNNYDDFLKER